MKFLLLNLFINSTLILSASARPGTGHSGSYFGDSGIAVANEIEYYNQNKENIKIVYEKAQSTFPSNFQGSKEVKSLALAIHASGVKVNIFCKTGIKVKICNSLLNRDPKKIFFRKNVSTFTRAVFVSVYLDQFRGVALASYEIERGYFRTIFDLYANATGTYEI